MKLEILYFDGCPTYRAAETGRCRRLCAPRAWRHASSSSR
jgi:hypothetical protein